MQERLSKGVKCTGCTSVGEKCAVLEVNPSNHFLFHRPTLPFNAEGNTRQQKASLPLQLYINTAIAHPILNEKIIYNWWSVKTLIDGSSFDE